MKTIIASISAAFLLASVSVTAFAQNAVPMEKVDAFVEAALKEQKIPGAAVAITKNGEPVLVKGYGIANLEHNVPVTPETIFQSGSVGKMFTATALMLQVEDGKVSLDAPVSKYLPTVPPAWRAITVRQLLTHTSGIPDYDESGKIDFRKDYTQEQLLKAVYPLPLDFKPSSRYSYSNSGYVFLGLIIEKVSGKFYGDVLSEHVFKPLGMKTKVINEADIIPHRAAGYETIDGQLKNQRWVSPSLNTMPDGALYMTINDLILWDRAVRDKRILKPESWAQILSPVKLNSGNTYPYGFGWDVAGPELEGRIRHDGAWQGFRAYASRYPKRDIGIYILVNGSADVMKMGDSLAELTDPGLADLEKNLPVEADPAADAKARLLLDRSARGVLTAADVPMAKADFIKWARGSYAETLKPLGKLEALNLVATRKLGDDRVFSYKAVYATSTLPITLTLAPANRVVSFDLGNPE
jgi:CubicO group peptidase (beta-lactamase class C family)